MKTAVCKDLAEEISEYWDERAGSYSNGVTGELKDGRHVAWRNALAEASSELARAAHAEGRRLRAADIGCGPGFFSALLSELGCEVEAVDGSTEMLARACANVQSMVPDARVTFHQGDFSSLPFEDDSIDFLASRNVTWLMRDPLATYAEWLRVLRPGGKLVVFDSNWYLYLADKEVDKARHAAQDGKVLEGWDDDAQATSDEERRCELIAAELPLTPIVRPAWDLEALASLGASDVRADERAWEWLWTKSEKDYYAYAPMFMVEAVK